MERNENENTEQVSSLFGESAPETPPRRTGRSRKAGADDAAPRRSTRRAPAEKTAEQLSFDALAAQAEARQKRREQLQTDAPTEEFVPEHPAPDAVVRPRAVTHFEDEETRGEDLSDTLTLEKTVVLDEALAARKAARARAVAENTENAPTDAETPEPVSDATDDEAFRLDTPMLLDEKLAIQKAARAAREKKVPQSAPAAPETVPPTEPSAGESTAPAAPVEPPPAAESPAVKSFAPAGKTVPAEKDTETEPAPSAETPVPESAPVSEPAPALEEAPVPKAAPAAKEVEAGPTGDERVPAPASPKSGASPRIPVSNRFRRSVQEKRKPVKRIVPTEERAPKERTFRARRRKEKLTPETLLYSGETVSTAASRIARELAALVIFLASVFAVFWCREKVVDFLIANDYDVIYASSSYEDPVSAPLAVAPQEISSGYAAAQALSASLGGHITADRFVKDRDETVFPDEVAKCLGDALPEETVELRAGLTNSEYLIAVHESLAAGRPVIALLGEPSGLHYGIVTDLDTEGDFVSVTDPESGIAARYSIEDFLAATQLKAYQNMPLPETLGLIFGSWSRNTAIFVK